MADDDKAALLGEAYKRGILPPDMKSAYEEAAKRGLVPAAASQPASPDGQALPADDTPKPGFLADTFKKNAKIAGQGLMEGVEGAAQLAAHVLPIPGSREAADAAVAARQEQFKKEGVGALNPARIAGNVANPLNYVGIGEAGTAASIAGKAAVAARSGAIGGAIQPVTDKNYWKEKLTQIGVGADTAGVASGALGALGKAVAPTIAANAKKLMDAGVKLTPGQIGGGALRMIENLATSNPITGFFIRPAERRSIESFNSAAINAALEPIGKSIPKGMEPGRKSIDAAQEMLSDSYDKVLGKLHFTVDPQFHADIGNLSTLVSEMPKDAQDQFNAILKNRVEARLVPNGTMDGQTLKQVESELTNKIAQFRSSSDAMQRQIGTALGEVRSAIRDALERQNPADAKELSEINHSYAMFSRVEDASIRRSDGGVFTPADLLNEIKSNAKRTGNKKAFARGDALMQDFADAAQERLPSKIPNSGTAERTAANNLAGSVLGGAAGTGAYFHPGTVIAGGLLAAPYTKIGQAATEKYVTPGPLRRYIGEQMGVYAPYASPAAAVSAQLGIRSRDENQ